jgi:hypothetical protein
LLTNRANKSIGDICTSVFSSLFDISFFNKPLLMHVFSLCLLLGLHREQQTREEVRSDIFVIGSKLQSDFSNNEMEVE